jgi:uncharacterized protein YqfB (UPF0267 family)
MSNLSNEQRAMLAWDMANRRGEQEERWAQQRLPANQDRDEVIPGVYVLDSKYYQKLGEGHYSHFIITIFDLLLSVWDHETKDFKVLYKPLYRCGSKPGSFEAHHLAVSTFIRWESKFIHLPNCRLRDLPADVQQHLVSSNCVAHMSVGNGSLPLQSTPFPSSMAKGSAGVHINIQDPSEAAERETATCRSISGFGSRSLTPYYVMDFSAQFQDIIKQGLKTATTRVLREGVEGGEPELMRLVHALATSDEGVRVQAVSDNHETDPPEVFATLLVTAVQSVNFEDLTETLAATEQFGSLLEFKDCLRGFYPWITDKDEVWIFYFELA